MNHYQLEQDLANYVRCVNESKRVIDSFLLTWATLSPRMKRYLAATRNNEDGPGTMNRMDYAEKSMAPIYSAQIDRYYEAAEDYSVFTHAANVIRKKLKRPVVLYPSYPKAGYSLLTYNPSPWMATDMRIEDFNHIAL
jgi:hypothetical protein